MHADAVVVGTGSARSLCGGEHLTHINDLLTHLASCLATFQLELVDAVPAIKAEYRRRATPEHLAHSIAATDPLCIELASSPVLKYRGNSLGRIVDVAQNHS